MRASGTCGKTSYIIGVPLLRNNGQKFLKFDKRHRQLLPEEKVSTSKRSANPT